MPPRSELVRRIPPLLLGLFLFGFGIALMVRAELGLNPWEVLHQGISRHTGIPIGTVGILVGFGIFLGWIPLRERAGIGTMANVVLVGVVIDLTLLWLPDPGSTAAAWAYLLVGAFLFGPGSGLYIGVHLDPGPRDGLMTGLARRTPLSVRTVRTFIEVGALIAGVALGGTVGLGTVVYALSVGPNVQWWLERLDRPHPPVVLEPVGR